MVRTRNKGLSHPNIRSGHHNFVAQLLKHGAKAKLADESGATALHYAVCWAGFEPCVAPDCVQAQNDEIACVNELLSSKVKDIADSEGRTAMMWAAGKGTPRSAFGMSQLF